MSKEQKCFQNGLQTSKKKGRPSTGFDKTAYMKEYMRKRRAKSLHTPYPVDENTTTK
jgi:hypothetical protein